MTRDNRAVARGLRVNERIRAREIRLIGADGHNVGVVPLAEAIQLAREQDLDLVEVAPNIDPPVCRILDYGKFRYQQAKREKDARKHQRGTAMHQVRMRPKIGEHDMDLKLRTAERLLKEGDRVKVTVMFRGREMTHQEIGHALLGRAVDKLKPLAVVEKPPSMEGRFLSLILVPTARKVARPQPQPEPVERAKGEEREVAEAEA